MAIRKPGVWLLCFLYSGLMRVCFEIKYFIGLVFRREDGKHRTFCVSDWELVKISPDRWPAVDGTERPEVSVFLLFSDWKAETCQVRGPGQVVLCPERVTRGLRWRSLTSSGGSLWKWIQHFNLPWLAFGQSASLSNTTKLILLDSLLQEVCIKSGLAGRSPLSSLRLSVCLVQSQTFFIQD